MCASPLRSFYPATDLAATEAQASVDSFGESLERIAAEPLLKPTCDEAGNWHYVPAVDIDGPRALDIPADPARVAVEGVQMDEVA